MSDEMKDLKTKIAAMRHNIVLIVNEFEAATGKKVSGISLDKINTSTPGGGKSWANRVDAVVIVQESIVINSADNGAPEGIVYT